MFFIQLIEAPSSTTYSNETSLELGTLYVDEPYRKFGIAKKAVQSAKSIAKLLGANALQLQTLNAALNPMYQKMGANVMGKGDFYSQPTTRLNFVI